MMQYVYMPDVVDCIAGASELQPGIYNLGGDRYIPMAESARLIADHFEAKVEFLRDRKEGETLPFMDTSKLKHAGATRFTPFEESLDQYLGALAEQFKTVSELRR
jgi:nucleoside-diphosphate-sugar epimerase